MLLSETEFLMHIYDECKFIIKNTERLDWIPS